MDDIPTEQKVAYEDPVPRILTQPLGDVPSYYRRVSSKSDLQKADFEAGSTVLGWIEMFHAYSGQPEAKQRLRSMHRYANKVFGEGDEQTITFEVTFEGNPKQLVVRTTDSFDFRACEQVIVGTDLNTECETTIGDMTVILDEISERLVSFAQSDNNSPYITQVALGFNIQPVTTTIGIRVAFDETQIPDGVEVIPDASYCTAMRSLGRDVDVIEEE